MTKIIVVSYRKITIMMIMMKMKITATKATVTITTTKNNKTILGIYHEGYLLKNEKRACASASASASACPYERKRMSECEGSLYTECSYECQRCIRTDVSPRGRDLARPFTQVGTIVLKKSPLPRHRRPSLVSRRRKARSK